MRFRATSSEQVRLAVVEPGLQVTPLFSTVGPGAERYYREYAYS